ncbi:MAG: GNAT family N-acetyltransferase [Planctomycetota bacterium]|jgi:ribosomal protein S18 acetylase RimI-like enzyme
MGEPTIERLHLSARPALLDVFTRAFIEQAFMPSIGRQPGTVRAVMKGFLRFFGGYRSLLLHGIRRDGRLVCGSVSADSSEEPSALAAALFFVELVRALGWRITTGFGTIHREQPKYDERYLELVLLGTSPSCQRLGLGRRMLRFICDEAKRRDYAGVILVTDRAAPAFRLYTESGFTVDSEFPFAGVTLCWMRWRALA